MSNINKIQINNITYDIEDKEARNNLLNKVDKIEGKVLSSNDFTDEEKDKLANLGGKGVHVGEDEPTDESINVWIDPTGEPVIIPTKTSELENDSKFVNEDYVNNVVGDIETLLGGI